MSRIGRRAIKVPSGVKIGVADGVVKVDGPKGSLSGVIAPGVRVEVISDTVSVQRNGDERQLRALHGLTRNLISNMVVGVSGGYKKELEIQGVGFKAEVQGQVLNLSLGYSHQVLFPIPKGITITVEKLTRLAISGIDRQLVGQVAANIRRLREPDIYKGKGVRYLGEVIKLKAGKTGAK